VQLPQKCLTPVKVCAMRFTRLTTGGAVAAGPKNSLVTDKITEIGVSPQIAEGAEVELGGACGCPIISFKNSDTLKRYNLAITRASLTAMEEEMLFGSALILDQSTTPVPIGAHNPVQSQCGARSQVAVEAWSQAVDFDAPDVDYPWIHWIWPRVEFRQNDSTLNADATTLPIAGFTRQNKVWGTGPYGDAPEAVQPNGSWWLSKTIPAVVCGYQTAASS
jgi:hypothetical protein